MSEATEMLLRSSREYELRSVASDDQAVAGDAEAKFLAIAWATVALVLREVAAAIELVERRDS